jgi:hypothetical protein
MGRHPDALLARAVNVALAPNIRKNRAQFPRRSPIFRDPLPVRLCFPVPADYRVLLREGDSLTIRASAASANANAMRRCAGCVSRV